MLTNSPGWHNKRDVGQRRNVYLARTVDLAQVLCRNDGLHVLDCNWQGAAWGWGSQIASDFA